MTKDERLHALGGFLLALPWSLAREDKRAQQIRRIDFYGWKREVLQHDEELTEHQISEARAWGKGARVALGISPPYPVPPYPA